MYTTIKTDELKWLVNCTDVQMMDGDTARALAELWIKQESAQDYIDGIEHKYPTIYR